MGLTANKLSLYNSICNCFCDVVSSTTSMRRMKWMFFLNQNEILNIAFLISF